MKQVDNKVIIISQYKTFIIQYMSICGSSHAEKMSFDLKTREITVNWLMGYFRTDQAYLFDYY